MRVNIHNLYSIRRIFWVCLFCTAAWSNSGAAQETRTITLTDAVGIALEQNIGLKQSQNEVELSESAVRMERVRYYPNLSLSLAPEQRYGRGFDLTVGRVEDERREIIDLVVSSRIDFGFERAASYKAAGLNLNVSRENLAQKRQRIVFETAVRFLHMDLAAELIGIEDKNLRAQRQRLLRIESLWEEGRRARADVLQQQAAVAEAELRLLKVNRKYESGQLRLKQMLNLSVDSVIQFPSATSGMERNYVPYDPGQVIGDAFTGRSDIRAQQQRLAARKALVRGAKAGHWPDLSLFMSAGTDYSSLEQPSGFSNQFFDENLTARIGLVMTFPIFDRFQTRHNVARARVREKNEELNLEELRQKMTFGLRQALLDYDMGIKQLQVAKVREKFSNEALAAVDTRYELGAATLAALSQAQANYVEAAGGLTEARYRLALQHLSVEYYRGHIVQAVASFASGG